MGYKVISTEMSTKELLDNAAVKLMAEKGENFTVRDICRLAGVSVGTFYTYYKSKDEISLERLQYMDQYLLDSYAEITGESCRDRLENFLSSYIFFSARRGLTFSREVYRSILMTTVSPDNCRNRVLYKIIYELIQEGQQKGEFTSSLSADTLSDSTVALIRGLAVNWCHQGGSYALTERVKDTFHVWLNGLQVKTS